MNIQTLPALALALLATSATATAARASTVEPSSADHGKLAWFDGTYEEALSTAAKSEKLIFMDFWTDW